MLEGVTIEQLRTLRAVASEGSFSAAARKLGRVQAAVSQSIDRLEAQLGLRLFDRTARVPKLTRHGEAIVAAAAKVHEDVEALDELVASLKRGVLSPRTWRVVDLATKHALIRGGLGWGHMPEHYVRKDLSTGRLLELRLQVWGSEPPRRSLLLVRRRGVAIGPVAQWVETRLTELCQNAVAT